MVRPKTYHDRTSTSLSFEKQMLNEFMELCWRERKTVSEKVTEMMQQELQKNVMGLTNPIKISYGETNKDNHKDCWRHNLDQWIFIDHQEAKEMIESLPSKQLVVVYHNANKLKQQLQLKMTGKITID